MLLFCLMKKKFVTVNDSYPKKEENRGVMCNIPELWSETDVMVILHILHRCYYCTLTEYIFCSAYMKGRRKKHSIVADNNNNIYVLELF